MQIFRWTRWTKNVSITKVEKLRKIRLKSAQIFSNTDFHSTVYKKGDRAGKVRFWIFCLRFLDFDDTLDFSFLFFFGFYWNILIKPTGIHEILQSGRCLWGIINRSRRHGWCCGVDEGWIDRDGWLQSGDLPRAVAVHLSPWDGSPGRPTGESKIRCCWRRRPQPRLGNLRFLTLKCLKLIDPERKNIPLLYSGGKAALICGSTTILARDPLWSKRAYRWGRRWIGRWEIAVLFGNWEAS